MENCEICGNLISSEDVYTNIIDYKNGNEASNKWYHANCWREKVLGVKEQKNRASEILDKIDKNLGNLLGTTNTQKKEEYIIN